MNTYEIPKIPGTEYGDFSAYLDRKYGVEGTDERRSFEEAAWNTYQTEYLPTGGTMSFAEPEPEYGHPSRQS